MKVENTCSIVTGGARGIGKAIVELIVSKGGNVIIADILEKEGQGLVDSINKAGIKKAIFVHCDVRKADQFKNLFAVATQEFGGAQTLFNNAGIVEPSAPNNSFERYIDLFQVNIGSVYQGTLLAKEHFNEQLMENPEKQFCIMNTGSSSALTPISELAFYSFTKNAICSFTNITSQLNWPNIRINCVAPCFTRTDLLKYNDKDETQVLELVYGLVEPIEVAQKMLELIEDDNSNGIVRFLEVDKVHDAKKVPLRLISDEISKALSGGVTDNGDSNTPMS